MAIYVTGLLILVYLCFGISLYLVHNYDKINKKR